MKKVGIMSMQRIFNYGSFLQAYGLKKIIESLDEEADITFIDYRPGEVLIESELEKRGFRRVLKKLKEYNSINTSMINKWKFFNHKRTYAKRFFPLLGLEETHNYDSNLDLLIIGSDEVFNCVQANSNVGYSEDLFGKNTNAKKIISYAGSFGNTTIEKIEKYNIKNDLYNNFTRFSNISVRDMNSKNIMHFLGDFDVSINIDPVLAYNFMECENRIPTRRINQKPYMIVYGYSGRLSSIENSIIKEFAKKHSLEILCFGGVQECCDKFIDCNPFELLAYFRDANFVVTDTFHGTIFSIINKKKFATIVRKSLKNNYGNEEKLTYLLNSFRLINRSLYDVTNESLNQLYADEIDYRNVFSILENKRDETLCYLKSSIERG